MSEKKVYSHNLEIELSHKDILSKKFDVNLSGYDANDVDAFLDKIILTMKKYEDHFEFLSKIINEKNLEINNKDEELKRLELKVISMDEDITRAIETKGNPDYLYETAGKVNVLEERIEEISSLIPKRKRKNN